MNQIAAIPWPKDPRYLITDNGQIIGPSGKTLKPRRHTHGYVRMSCIVAGKTKDFYVHRIVCETFHGPAREGVQVDHINGNRSDNRPKNLRWVSPEINKLQRRHPIGLDHHNAILSDNQVTEIKLANGSQAEIAKKYGVSREHVRDIRNGKARTYVK